MRVRLIFAVLSVTAAMAGCATAPILNVNDAAVTSAAGKTLSNDQVRSAIVRAGAGLGWQMEVTGPNLLRGTLQLRKHTAVVDISYSNSNYSIKYRSSMNLNESKGSIHKNYNGWIENLTKGINSQLTAI